MGRKVRILHFPLAPLKEIGIKNPLISHWALLIGQNDLLLEIFPEQGKNIFTPRNVLHVSKAVTAADIAARKGKFKFGIFPQADTNKSDDEIIKAANDVVHRNPIYLLVGYNCQRFVSDLASAIETPKFMNTVKKGLRKWLPWWAKPYLDLDGTPEAKLSPEEIAREATVELEYFMEMGERLRSAGGVETTVADVDPGQRGPEESKALEAFALEDQNYLHIDDEGPIAAGDGIVYGLTKQPAYEIMGISLSENERGLSAEEPDKYRNALMIVGQERSIEVN